MQSFIKEAYKAVPGQYGVEARALIDSNKYDLINTARWSVILPSQWKSVLEPGMNLNLALYRYDPLDFNNLYSHPHHDGSTNGWEETTGSGGKKRHKHRATDTKKQRTTDNKQTPFAPPSLLRPNYLRLPQSSSLPHFEELGIKENKERTSPRHPGKKAFASTSASNHISSPYRYSEDSRGAYYPHSISSHFNQAPPVLQPTPSAQVATRHSNFEQTDEDLRSTPKLEQNVQGPQAEQQKKECMAETIGDEDHALMEDEPTETRRADSPKLEASGSMGTDATVVATPMPVEFQDSAGRRFLFPYELCSTWEVCLLVWDVLRLIAADTSRICIALLSRLSFMARPIPSNLPMT